MAAPKNHLLAGDCVAERAACSHCKITAIGNVDRKIQDQSSHSSQMNSSDHAITYLYGRQFLFQICHLGPTCHQSTDIFALQFVTCHGSDHFAQGQECHAIRD